MEHRYAGCVVVRSRGSWSDCLCFPLEGESGVRQTVVEAGGGWRLRGGESGMAADGIVSEIAAEVQLISPLQWALSLCQRSLGFRGQPAGLRVGE